MNWIYGQQRYLKVHIVTEQFVFMSSPYLKVHILTIRYLKVHILTSYKVSKGTYTHREVYFITHRFEVHLKLYCTQLTVYSLCCYDLNVRYQGYSCPNVPALAFQISVMSSPYLNVHILTSYKVSKGTYTHRVVCFSWILRIKRCIYWRDIRTIKQLFDKIWIRLCSLNPYLL